MELRIQYETKRYLKDQNIPYATALQNQHQQS